MLIYTIILAFFCLLIFLCFIDYKGKISSKVLYIAMFFIMAYVTSNVDMPAYIMMYDRINGLKDIGVTDPGFGFLMYIGKISGFDYYEFIKWLTLVGLIFVSIVFKKKSRCPAMILSIYFILVFPVFTVQIRSFIAETVMYILIVDMVEKENFKMKEFIIILCVAVLFHAVSLFFVLLSLPIIVKNRRIIVLIVVAAILAVPFTSIILKFVPIPMVQQKLHIYFLANRASIGLGMLVYILLYWFIMICIDYMQKQTGNSLWKKRLNLLMDINIVGLIACAMVIVFNSNFYRMIRVIMMSDFLVIVNYSYENKRFSRKNLLLLYGAFLVLFLGGELMTGQLLGILTNNSITSTFFDM